MTAANLAFVYCDACGLPASELAAGADTAATARRQLAGRGWLVNVREATADRRLDFCPLHRGARRQLSEVGAISNGTAPTCDQCPHWVGRHDPDYGSCDSCPCVNRSLIEPDD